MKAAISRRRLRRSLRRLRHRRFRATVPERLEAGDDEPCELIGPGAEQSLEGG